MNTRRFLLTASASLVLLSVVSLPAGARGNFGHTTYVTFNGPVSLPRTTLPAGQYTFEYLAPPASSDVVVVRSVHDPKLQWLGLTNRVHRERGTQPGTIRLSEARANELPRVLIWFAPESSFGNAFRY